MTIEQTVLIRKFSPGDRQDVRRIGCETAFLGDPLDFCFDDRELLADALTLYFTDYEPETCFVAVKDDKVVGYLLGTENSANMERAFKTRIAPRLFAKAVRRGALIRPNTQRFFAQVALSLLKGEFSAAQFFEKYPATLHVNVDKSARRKHVGTGLMEHYLRFLQKERIPGVHVSTMSARAKSFFEKLGFNPLLQGKRSFLRYCLGQDLPFYILGKKL